MYDCQKLRRIIMPSGKHFYTTKAFDYECGQCPYLSLYNANNTLDPTCFLFVKAVSQGNFDIIDGNIMRCKECLDGEKKANKIKHPPIPDQFLDPGMLVGCGGFRLDKYYMIGLGIVAAITALALCLFGKFN